MSSAPRCRHSPVPPKYRSCRSSFRLDERIEVTAQPSANNPWLAQLKTYPSPIVETPAELNLRTIAQLAGVSQAQASRVLPGLVELGVVERREVPPASLFRLVPEQVAARALVALARSADTVLDEVGRLTASLPHPPTSVIIFGSFARREAGPDSDIDLLVVRPTDIDEDDEDWAAPLEQWRGEVRRLAGNPVEVLEVSTDEAAARLAGKSPLWAEIRRDGQVIHGLGLDDLRVLRHA